MDSSIFKFTIKVASLWQHRNSFSFPTFWPILFRTQTPERRFEHLSYSYRDLMGSAPSCRCVWGVWREGPRGGAGLCHSTRESSFLGRERERQLRSNFPIEPIKVNKKHNFVVRRRLPSCFDMRMRTEKKHKQLKTSERDDGYWEASKNTLEP